MSSILRAHGVLPTEVVCPRCQTPCSHFTSPNNVWICNNTVPIPHTRRRKRCNFSVSDRKGSFLQRIKLPTDKLIMFITMFLSNMWEHRAARLELDICIKTSVDWRSMCSEVLINWVGNQEPIGGEGVVVEIDESVLVKRKYNKGRPLSQVWVFGGIERLSKKKFIIPLLDGNESMRRDKETLIPLIQRYIKPGSIIMSDCWAAYSRLSELGYRHHQINHSENFVDPSDETIHTQCIERLWGSLKKKCKRPGMKKLYLRQYISRFLFLEAYEPEERLHIFLIEAKKFYPPGSEPSLSREAEAEANQETDSEEDSD